MDIERLKELRKSLNAENWNAKTKIEVIALTDDLIARHDNFVKHLRAAIAALQEYHPMVRKDRIVEEVAISKTETTSEPCSECRLYQRFVLGDGVK